ncbi:MAG: methyltransferase domain-containing protein [Filomicrobium sp.]
MNIEVVRDYYGKVLQTSADLKTDACCTTAGMPDYLKSALANVHDEVLAKYYGCGLVLPEALEGARVLDLGCGTGRDVYALAQMVGARGEVVGVDMTDEQLTVASEHVDWHQAKFGYAKPNTRFVKGYIEKLGELGLKPASFDLVVSNCVVNLSPDKAAVLRGAYELLKPGGEMYFADVYADRRLDDEIKNHPVLVGECLGGALYWNDFLDTAKSSGFEDPRLVSARPLEIHDPEIIEKLGSSRFVSATYRLFKLDEMDAGCENYGQTAIYKGGIPHHEDVFHLDAHHPFPRGQVIPICGNTQRMLSDTRLKLYFELIGDFGRHYGIYPGCGTSNPFATIERQKDAEASAMNVATPSCC